MLIWLTAPTKAELTEAFKLAIVSRLLIPVVFGPLLQFVACAKAPEHAVEASTNAIAVNALRLIKLLMPMPRNPHDRQNHFCEIRKGTPRIPQGQPIPREQLETTILAGVAVRQRRSLPRCVGAPARDSHQNPDSERSFSFASSSQLRRRSAGLNPNLRVVDGNPVRYKEWRRQAARHGHVKNHRCRYSGERVRRLHNLRRPVQPFCHYITGTSAYCASSC